MGAVQEVRVGGIYGHVLDEERGDACGHGTMILSACPGSSGRVPRVNNLPSIVACEVKKMENLTLNMYCITILLLYD